MNKQPSNRENWFRRYWLWIVIAVFAAALLSRVTIHFGYIDQDKKEAADRIEEFHRRMNMGEFNQLYDDADPAFKRTLKREVWLKHMQDARDEYGSFKSAESSKVNVIMAAPVQIRAVSMSNFEKGTATELFAFAREGHNVQLLAYGIYPATKK